MKKTFIESYGNPHVRNRTKILWRRLLVDILPTIFILMLMACAMLLVARYIETSHFRPLVSNGYESRAFFVYVPR